jgi:hypothetical protein
MPGKPLIAATAATRAVDVVGSSASIAASWASQISGLVRDGVPELL